ncbi:MAG: glycerol-3-phosphate dehydrogenase/oxidase [Undibacterium sp.]|uniref:glycerol-3-phosphate dehydrogenase/oxidase n=1 Tax=Undibacterium sp. TaxID=1914977 RepID=UPI00271BDB7F|nr:glycerol-3-phosphate dehydrogenase/oxidase [Undibacterium sp.]MDO8651709.1 glycerol-3-phosphate dehydrogenase/oxidase [Undibacterium sp.]
MKTGLWNKACRQQIPAQLAQEWDLVIVGGGITGAGILLEAARRGLKVLLVEQRDFAWGTSSRSSKLVHGGLRYLKEGKFQMTRDSVHERQNLMQEAAGLVDQQSFAFADYRGRKPGRWIFALGLAIYDLMAGQRGARHYYPADEFLQLAPHIGQDGLNGGMCYIDAKTDDARLVLRVLQEAQSVGGVALNYLAAKKLLRADGLASGVELLDAITGASHRVHAKVIISATGAWADGLRQQQGAPAKIRPLRGSHLVLPAWRLPVAQAISLMHPKDGRPVFAFPWEGVTLVGTTDVDHSADLQIEAKITPDEVRYLMAALEFQFPQLHLTLDDIIATYAGVRPVIDTGKADPSKEGRDHAVWLEQGLLTVTGGKLTTFRLIALDALKHVAPLLPHWQADLSITPLFSPGQALPLDKRLGSQQSQRLQGHYGQHAVAVLAAAQEGELEPIAGSETMWVELRWAARHEAVLHLEDLLLRRTRLGLLLRGGGGEILPRIRAICQPELGWSDAQWETEQAAYLALWQSHYSLPPRAQMKES